MDPLTPTKRRSLRAKAHHLEPVVIVGHHGLTPPVLHEIDLALLAHDLVKVRVLGDDRDAREAMLGQACAALDCAPVQHVGKVLVLWRPNPERKPAPKPEAAPRKSARKQSANPAARGRKTKSTAARTPLDPVRDRRRKARESGGMQTGHRRGAARHAPPEEPGTASAEPPTQPRRRRG
jgi:putative YhbY family RNA-binding protein